MSDTAQDIRRHSVQSGQSCLSEGPSKRRRSIRRTSKRPSVRHTVAPLRDPSLWGVDLADLSDEANGSQQAARGTTADLDGDAWRQKVFRFLEDDRVESAIGVILCLNVVSMVLETNYKASCVTEGTSCPDSWHLWANWFFQIFYSLEVLLRLWTFRWNFWKNHWHKVDFTVVLLGYVDIIFTCAIPEDMIEGDKNNPGVALVRLFRITRLLRILRMCSFFPDLYIMVRGFVGAVMAMFWGMVMICALLLVFSIISVEVIHPVNMNVDHEIDWCREAFSSVQYCILHYFQTVFAADEWGNCHMPIVVEYAWTLVIFGGVMATIQLGFTNLILAVIVDRAAQSRAADAEERGKQRQKERLETYTKIKDVMTLIDLNGNGEISAEELAEGIRNSGELRRLLVLLDLEEEDLLDMFNLMADEDGTTTVENFVGTLLKGEQADLDMQVLVLDLELKKIIKDIKGFSKDVEDRAAMMAGPPGTPRCGTPREGCCPSCCQSENGSSRPPGPRLSNFFDSDEKPAGSNPALAGKAVAAPTCPRSEIIDSVTKDLRAGIVTDLDHRFTSLFEKLSTIMAAEKFAQVPPAVANGARTPNGVSTPPASPKEEQTGGRHLADGELYRAPPRGPGKETSRVESFSGEGDQSEVQTPSTARLSHGGQPSVGEDALERRITNKAGTMKRSKDLVKAKSKGVIKEKEKPPKCEELI